MVVHCLHEPKTLRPISNPTSELCQKGALLTWIYQTTSYPRMKLIGLTDGKQTLMNQSTNQLTCPKFRDLQEIQILSLQTSQLQPDGKEHRDQQERIKPIIAFQIIPDLLQRIYLLLFLHVQKIHLHPNQELLQCQLITE